MATRGCDLEMVPVGQILQGLANLGKSMNYSERMDVLIADLHAGGIRYEDAVREFKRRYVIETLKAHNGNQCRTADAMKMHRNTFSRLCAALKITPSKYVTRRKATLPNLSCPGGEA